MLSIETVRCACRPGSSKAAAAARIRDAYAHEFSTLAAIMTASDDMYDEDEGVSDAQPGPQQAAQLAAC